MYKSVPCKKKVTDKFMIIKYLYKVSIMSILYIINKENMQFNIINILLIKI